MNSSSDYRIIFHSTVLFSRIGRKVAIDSRCYVFDFRVRFPLRECERIVARWYGTAVSFHFQPWSSSFHARLVDRTSDGG